MNEKELDKAIRLAKKQAELDRINRDAKYEVVNDLVSFATRKISAVSLVGLGGLEILQPSIISALEMGQSSSVAAITVGLGMLGGKQLADALQRLSGGGQRD